MSVQEIANKYPLDCEFTTDARYVWPERWAAITKEMERKDKLLQEFIELKSKSVTLKDVWYLINKVEAEFNLKGDCVMLMKNEWKITDEVSGLTIEVISGENLDKLHIESIKPGMNRDFYFTKDGEFDGTSSVVSEQ